MMAITSFSLSSPQLLFFFFFILSPFNYSIASPNLNRRSQKLSLHNSLNHSPNPKPKPIFQVTKPIDLPNTVPCKQLLLDHHEFSSTGGNPQLITNYDGPPSNCGSQAFSKIVLETKGTLNGTQDDAVFGVWLNGVELLRSSPPQGSNRSVAWVARKDITKYSSLLHKKHKQQQLVVAFRTFTFLKNAIAVYHLTISLSFYPHHPDHNKSSAVRHDHDASGFKSDSNADIILPISQNLKPKQQQRGLWFSIENSTDVKFVGFSVPRNAYRAVLEVYVSPHHYEQFWYSNYPPEFYNSNQYQDVFGNGPFRDVVIALDDVVAGAIWPYTVITGARYDMWNPVGSIRCFDLPSYDVELTPFLGNLLDGGIHNVSFSVGNALNVWYVNANLHLWLDDKSSRTKGKLVSNFSQPLDLSSTLRMNGFNGESWVEAQRIVASEGWVQSSYGNITVHVSQNLSYTNYMEIDEDGYSTTAKQLILSNDSVSFVKNDDVSGFHSFIPSMKSFSVMMKDEVKMEEDGDVVARRDIKVGYSDEKRYEDSASKFVITSSLKDQQSGNGVFTLKNHTWEDTLQVMNQSYQYHKVNGNINTCYLRKINTLNADIVFDNQDGKC